MPSRRLIRIAALVLPCAGAACSGVVKTIPGYGVTYPKGQIGGSSARGLPAPFVSLPPAREYVLDYQVRFESDFVWVKGGKLPGLVGGSHTSGCTDVRADGWSARFMWQDGPPLVLYMYHQNRRSGCGDTYGLSRPNDLAKNRWNRITQRIVINAPGQSNGVVEAWLDGRKAASHANFQLRGRVAESVALVDAVSLQTFYGGSSSSWAPPHDTHATFSDFHVRDDLPDFSVPFERSHLGVAILPPAGYGPGLRWVRMRRDGGAWATWDAAGFPVDARGRRLVVTPALPLSP